MAAPALSGRDPDFTIDAIIPLRKGDRSIAKIRIGPVSATVFLMDVNSRPYVSWPQSGKGHALIRVTDADLRERIEEEIIDRGIAR
tara:strand:- start:834 stop:1091 length:258 start_codon:yes stop_codon:yes gene_type:complete